MLHIHAQETTLGNKKYDYCRLKLMAQRHFEQKIKVFHLKAKKTRRGQTCDWSSEQGEAKGKGTQNAKNTSERGDSTRWTTKANVCLEKLAHSSMTRTMRTNGRDDFVHLLRQVHRTESRRVTGKVTMLEVLKAHQKFWGKVRQGKRTD